MSRHPSFGKRDRVKASRNVLKRYERIEILKKLKKWKEGDTAFGLPKTKSL